MDEDRGQVNNTPVWSDPVYDAADPHITPATPDLPAPPDHDEEPAPPAEPER